MSRRAGFTLVEILVVVVLIGVLAAIGIPQYTRTMENSKADGALTMAQMIATTNGMFRLDYPAIGFLNGPINNLCNSGPCPGSMTDEVCNLVRCGYIARQNFDGNAYEFFAGDGTPPPPSNPCGFPGAVTTVACAKRRIGALPPGTTTSPYDSWGYWIDPGGVVTESTCGGCVQPPPPP